MRLLVNDKRPFVYIQRVAENPCLFLNERRRRRIYFLNSKRDGVVTRRRSNIIYIYFDRKFTYYFGRSRQF